VVVFMIVI